MNFIPVNRPKIPKNTQKYIHQCLKSDWLSSEGPYVTEFESKFAKFLGVKYATSTNSGTTALHLALLALDIKPNDEVILPALTIASCYFAIWYCGAKAVPVDVDPLTFNLDPKLIEAKITKKTKAIMPVHLYGLPCDMSSILKIAKKYHLKVIEDAAEAHGAEYKGKKVGSFGDVACFSFYANKIVTCGEGGMLTTNHKEIYQRAKSLKNLNHVPNRRFTHEGVGYKYVLSNLQAAVGLASLEEISQSIAYKEKMARIYKQDLQKIKGLVLSPDLPEYKNVYWMYSVLVKEKEFGMSRDKLAEILLNKYQIQTRTFFYPPNIAFKTMGLYQNERFPVAERLSQEGLYLPSGLGNTMKEFKFVAKVLKEISRL